MKSLNINANIVDASLKEYIDYDELIRNNFVSREFTIPKNTGRIACHYSHIKVIQDFLKSNNKTLFIFEDDIDNNIVSNYESIIKDSMNNIPDNWDLVYFGKCIDRCKKTENIHNNLYKLKFTLCGHAYGMTRNSDKKILKYTIPLDAAGDTMIANNISNGNIIAYGTHPSIFKQNRSVFGTTLGNKMLHPPDCAQSFHDRSAPQLLGVHLLLHVAKSQNSQNQ